MLGLAAGDALGTTLEFKPLGSGEALIDMVGRGPIDLPAGPGPMTRRWRFIWLKA